MNEKLIYEAFLHAALKLGPRLKGLSCFLRSWPTLSKSVV